MSRTRKFPTKSERLAYALGRLDEREYIAGELYSTAQKMKKDIDEEKGSIRRYIEGKKKKVQHG